MRRCAVTMAHGPSDGETHRCSLIDHKAVWILFLHDLPA
jgi:hypothetical protein